MKKILLVSIISTFFMIYFSIIATARDYNYVELEKALNTLENLYINSQITKELYQEKRERIEKLLEQFKDSDSTSINKGMKEEETKDIVKVKQYQNYMEKGEELSNQKKYSRAIDIFQKAIRVGKEINEKELPYWQVGSIYLHQGKDTLAKRAFEDYIDNDEVPSEACKNVGKLYVRYKNYDKAVDYFKMAIEKNSDWEKEESESYFIELADTYLNLGKEAKAKRVYSECIRTINDKYRTKECRAKLEYLKKN